MTTPAGPGLGGTLLTLVPAAHPHFSAHRTDWADQASVHRSVMALFDSDLPGDAQQRRAGSGILHRLESTTSGPRVLVQAATPTQRTDHGIRSTTLAGLHGRLNQGARIAFRVDVNAVRTQARTGQRQPLPIDDIAGFLLDPESPARPGLLARAVTAVRLNNVELMVRRTNQIPLHVACLTGVARIDDPNVLTDRILNGIGRGKAYGCGLLSVIPT